MPNSPGWVQGYIPSATEWNNEFASKVDFPAPINQGGTGGTTAAGANYGILQRGLLSYSPATLSPLTTLGVRTSLSPYALTLPALSGLVLGDWIILYDAEYNAAANNVTVAATGTDAIFLYGTSSASVVLDITDFWAVFAVGVEGWRLIVRTA